MLKNLHPTAFHLQLYLRNPPESTPAQRLGTLAHSLILEPDKELPKLAIQPAKYDSGEGAKDWNNNAKFCRRWVEFQKSNGYDVVKTHEYEAIHRMANSVANFKPSRELLEEGESEVSLFQPIKEWVGNEPFSWQEWMIGKCRFDWVTPGNTIMDVKTCTDASENEFRWTILNNRYHSQGAWYLDLWNADASRERKNCYVIIAVEKKPPYLCACYLLDDAMIEAGRRLNAADVATYAACKESGEWPAYPQEYVRMMLPEKYRRNI